MHALVYFLHAYSLIISSIDSYEDGICRFAPELEVHLENLWQESRDGRRSPGPLVIAWQDPRTDSVHYTDVRAMKDSTGNGSHRDVGCAAWLLRSSFFCYLKRFGGFQRRSRRT